MTPPLIPLQWAFNTATFPSVFSSGDKLQPYMWSFYSNPVASMNSSVNFPIGCLTKREKQKRLCASGWLCGGGVCILSVTSTRYSNSCCWAVTSEREINLMIFSRFLEVFKKTSQQKKSNDYIGKHVFGQVPEGSNATFVTSSQEVHGEDTVNSQQEKPGVRVQRTGHNLPC